MQQSLELIDYLIELETKRDAEHKKLALASNRGDQSIGESKILFHLKALKELVQKEHGDIVLKVSGYPFSSCCESLGKITYTDFPDDPTKYPPAPQYFMDGERLPFRAP